MDLQVLGLMSSTSELVPDSSLLLEARERVYPVRHQNLLTRLGQCLLVGRSRAGTRRDTASTLLFQEQVAGSSLDERENIAWGTRKTQSLIRQYYYEARRTVWIARGHFCTKLIEARVMRT